MSNQITSPSPQKDGIVSGSNDRTKPLPNATSFFFKARPRQLLSSVKRALSQEDGCENPSLPSGKSPPIIHSDTDSKEFEAEDDIIIIAEDLNPVASRPIIDLSIEQSNSSLKPSKELSIEMKAEGMINDNIDPLLMAVARKFVLSSAITSNTPLIVLFHDDYSQPAHGPPPHDAQEYNIFPTEAIWKKFRPHCIERRVNAHSIVLTYNGIRIFSSATPASLGITSNRFTIHAMLETDYKRREEERLKRHQTLLNSLSVQEVDSLVYLQESAGESFQNRESNIPPVDEQSITLRIKHPQRAKPIDITIKPVSTSHNSFHQLQDSPLSSAQTVIRTSFILSSKCPIKLIFDGDVLDLSKSPIQLQLEDSDLLELRLQH